MPLILGRCGIIKDIFSSRHRVPLKAAPGAPKRFSLPPRDSAEVFRRCLLSQCSEAVQRFFAPRMSPLQWPPIQWTQAEHGAAAGSGWNGVVPGLAGLNQGYEGRMEVGSR